jgi:hypothetical protein
MKLTYSWHYFFNKIVHFYDQTSENLFGTQTHVSIQLEIAFRSLMSVRVIAFVLTCIITIFWNKAKLESNHSISMAFRACSRYIHSLKRLDHGRQVLWALRWQIMLGFSFCRFFVPHPCHLFSLFRFVLSVRTRNLVVPAHRSLARSQSFVVLGCRAWNALPHAMKILSTLASFVPAVRRMVCGVTHVFCFCGTHHFVEC